MKTLIGKILAWFLPASKTEHTLLDLEMRIMGLEQDVHHLKGLLQTDSISLAGMSKKSHDEHFQTIVRKAVEESFDFDTLVEEAIENHDFADSISDALDDAISNKDWDYELREAVDWDKVADQVVRKIDWSDIISDNCLLTSDDIDVNDLMLQSEQMSDDEVIKREDLGEEVANQLKRDWFPMMVIEQVNESFDKKLMNARETENANARNAIDDEISAKVDELIREQMRNKFGPEFDNWFNENIRHCIKVVLGEFLEAAYQQTKETK